MKKILLGFSSPSFSFSLCLLTCFNLSCESKKIVPKALPSKPFSEMQVDRVKEVTLQQFQVRGDLSQKSFRMTRNERGEFLFPDSTFDFKYADRIADSTFLNHFLDSLRTLEVVGEFSGESLSQAGLDPAFFIIGFREGDSLYEIKLGEIQASSGGTYALVRAAHSDEPRKAVIRSSVTALLETLGTLSKLRERKLTFLEEDDVYSFEIKNSDKAFFAQRQGAEWTDVKEKKLTADAAAWLTRFLHLRVKRFIDDEKEWLEIKKDFATSPSRTKITFFDFKKVKLCEIEVRFSDSKLIVKSSLRENSFLELETEASFAFLPPQAHNQKK